MDVMTTPRPSEQQRRTLALAMLRELLPTLYDIARNEVEDREAAGDLVPGALTANDVVDGVVPTAYRQLVTDPDQHTLAAGLRRLAVDHISRELARVNVEESAILCDDATLYVPASLLVQPAPAPAPASRLDAMLEASEQQMIEDALTASGGRVAGRAGAAALLRVPPSTLESKIRRLRIDKFRFRATGTTRARQ